MWRTWLVKILLGALVSAYFFPFEFTFLPGYNTKMIMAALGLALWGINLSKQRAFSTNASLLNLSVMALIVSLIGVVSVVINNTRDYTYATYVVSMWVWLGGAFFVVETLKTVHKKVSVEIFFNYLVGVCVAQCVIAILIDNVGLIEGLVNRFVATSGFVDQATLANKDRLYGIGCALDVAGTRFAAVLLMLSVLIGKNKERGAVLLYTYLISFVIIVVIGNMISRTTTVGVILSILYALIRSLNLDFVVSKSSIQVFKRLLIMALIAIPILVSLYNTNANIREDIRFAFEGFFSLAEKGEWDVHSNDRLMTMYVFPDNTKTWIIGDGYFDGPSNTDPYYVGPTMTGFYMWTDVGYLRFIFYFGVIGLVAFMIFFYKCAQTCAKKFPSFKFTFWLLLLLNYIIWFKVATDIFVVFAPFLCISMADNDAYEKENEDSIPDSLDV